MEFGDLAQLFGEILTRHGYVRKHPMMHRLVPKGLSGTGWHPVQRLGAPYCTVRSVHSLFLSISLFLLFLYYHSVLLYD